MELLVEHKAMKDYRPRSLILMMKLHLGHKQGKPDMDADPVNQTMTRLGEGLGQEQGTRDPHQTTLTRPIGFIHPLHQAREIDTLLYETQAQPFLMNLALTVTAHLPQLTMLQPHSPPEADRTRPHPSKGNEAQGRSYLNSVMSVEQSTRWKMPNSAVNVE